MQIIKEDNNIKVRWEYPIHITPYQKNNKTYNSYSVWIPPELREHIPTPLVYEGWTLNVQPGGKINLPVKLMRQLDCCKVEYILTIDGFQVNFI